jgi:PAS domain S-box-containing protein
MDIHPEKDIAYVIEQFEQQAKGLISLAKDMPVIRKNGSIFYVDINSAIITIAGKQYITRFFRDITERKQTEAELVRAHKQLQHLLDAASQISIIHTDLAGTILTFTRGAERMLGYSAAEMIGKQTPAIIHLASEMAARGQELTRELGYPVEGFEVFVAYAKQGKHDEREWTYVRKDGKYIIVDLIVTAVRDEFDNITGFLGIANDITERKLVIEAQAANSAKSQFVANISHEIRTPLNGIIGICELLLETKLSGEQLEYARIIDSSAENLLNIVNATLDFSKIEAGKMVLENIDFNLREIIEDTIGILSINASKKKLELTDFIESEVPIYLHGDPSRLRQILVNLVGNAIKFTFKGDISLKVALLEENHARATLRFSVQDTGIGIPADKTAAIFNSFTQADVSLARRFGGTGLGLSIAKGLTEQMGGKIGVDSDYGKGSIFWFVVPFAKQQHPTPAFLPHANLGEAKILVVDDNAANRMLLVQQLRAWHISIATAAGGAEALATMRSAAQKKHPFAAAIIDLCMPEMDGIRLAQAIKADSALKRTILLLMSAMLQLPATYSQYKHLFAAMIVKPIRQAYLLHSLLTSLKGTKMSVIEKKWWAEFQRHQQFNVGNRLHILVAEDNIANQQVILSILERMGHVANAVANGHETVTALETVAYDLVLMDIQMPEMDGIQATALIRDPASKVIDHGIPILALTAHAMEGDREKCLTAGMNGYITKPVSIKAIADAIAKIAITTKIFSSRDKKQRSTQAGGRPAANRIRSNTANAIIKESPRRDKAASEPHPSPATAVFDSKAFADRLRGNRASMLKIINIILKETPKLARQFERSVKSCAQEPAARLAHNIKGSAANIGGNQLFAVAAQIETACNLGDWTGAKHLLPELRRTLSGLERALRHFKTKLSIAKEESHENSRRR